MIYKSVKHVAPLHIIVTYIKENIITKLQKLHSLPRNLRAGIKLPTLFLKKPVWTADLVPLCKILIERPVTGCQWSSFCIESHGDEVTDVYDKKVPKLDSNHTCLAVIALDSAVKKNDNYYPQGFLKECKYIEKKVGRHIHDNLSDFSYSPDKSDDSDKE